MRFERIDERNFQIVLSERNFLTLLAKLGMPCSARTIFIDTDEGTMAVSAEPNLAHYLDKDPPGPMSVQTEVEVERLSAKLRQRG